MIAIIDYNMGNLASVRNAFYKIGENIDIITDPEDIKKYDKIILPGVGAFKDAIDHLNKYGMKDAIIEFANSGKYLLGICLGMQLLFNESEEFGNTKGLDLIEGKVKYFIDIDLKVPHMGWNEVFLQNNKLVEGLNNPFLYFVHSLHVVTDDKYVIGKTYYGYEFASIVNKDNIYGIQPHPEKSHNEGLKILHNFVNL